MIVVEAENTRVSFLYSLRGRVFSTPSLLGLLSTLENLRPTELKGELKRSRSFGGGSSFLKVRVEEVGEAGMLTNPPRRDERAVDLTEQEQMTILLWKMTLVIDRALERLL